MTSQALEHILNLTGSGYGRLNPELQIVDCNENFSNYSIFAGDPKGCQITEVVPEAVGLNDILKSVANGERPIFRIERIHRDQNDRDPIYIDIAFYALPDADAPLICVIQNTTENTHLAHQIKQQQNEIRLLESVVRAQSEMMSAAILGESEPIRTLKAAIEKMARIPAVTVLLEGESGTGKSMVARVIHNSSQSGRNEFVEINCAALPENLLEAELFGYEKGAFTHAVAEKKGLIEAAEGGTLFLDEITELPLKLQAKLLTFLETRRFRRLGGTTEKSVTLRVIAATNRNLEELVANGDFREDLYYRLDVLRLTLPALRELDSDVEVIALNFVRLFNSEFGKHIKGLDKSALQKISTYQWPGNVRELRNVIERAMIFCESDEISSQDLLLGRGTVSANDTGMGTEFTLPPDGLPFLEIEKKLLLDALKLAEGNQSGAARLLHLSRDAFRYRLEKHDLL